MQSSGLCDLNSAAKFPPFLSFTRSHMARIFEFGGRRESRREGAKTLGNLFSVKP